VMIPNPTLRYVESAAHSAKEKAPLCGGAKFSFLSKEVTAKSVTGDEAFFYCNWTSILLFL